MTAWDTVAVAIETTEDEALDVFRRGTAGGSSCATWPLTATANAVGNYISLTSDFDFDTHDPLDIKARLELRILCQVCDKGCSSKHRRATNV